MVAWLLAHLGSMAAVKHWRPAVLPKQDQNGGEVFSKTTQPIQVGPSNPHGRVHWLCGNRGGEPAQWPPAENTSPPKLGRQPFHTVGVLFHSP